jgi:hypothetical protein
MNSGKTAHFSLFIGVHQCPVGGWNIFSKIGMKTYCAE